jgi:hypothetical protein
VPITECFGRLLRIGLYKARVAVRQVHRKEVDLAFRPGDLCQRLAKINLRMSRIVPQRHEHLAMPQPVRPHVVLNDGDPASVAVLVANPFEDPLCRVPLLLGPRLVRRQDRIYIPVNGSSFGRVGGRLRRYPGGTENASIFATVGSMPKRRAASRRLTPSI